MRFELIVIFVLTATGALRRVATMLVIAVVISAAELDRRPVLATPTPIVVMLSEPPRLPQRLRPYRAHHRYSRPRAGESRW